MSSKTEAERLRVVLFSFGYKYGVPLDVNVILDVRFLPNPYWVGELRAGTGREKHVAAYVLESSEGVEFLHHLQPMIGFLVEQYRKSGKKNLRIAFGCTGGRHRSVAIAESTAAFLTDFSVEQVIFHRDIDRDRG
ncbi:RapZ C-terminal domain-containing protein [Desulfomarina sp.]